MATKTIVLGIAAVVILACVALCGIGGVVYFSLCCPPDLENAIIPGSGSRVAASEIMSVEFYESSWMTHYDPTPTAFFGKVDPQNSILTTIITSFSSDGKAAKRTTIEKTTGGKKDPVKQESLTAVIDGAQFTRLAETLIENDFLNAEGGSVSTAVITKRLTITYIGGERRIVTNNTGPDPHEVTQILQAFSDLERETKWQPVP